PTRLGGWGHIFGVAQTHFTSVNPATKKPYGTFIPTSKAIGSTQLDFATLPLGSALALFIYPHSITGTLAAKRRSGIAFSGRIIGALVPAAIMGIAAANLFTRNIFKEFFKPDASPRLQTRVSKWASLVVKLGALYFAVELPHTFAINLQLLGGVWILQLFPMLVAGLFTRWFDRWAL